MKAKKSFISAFILLVVSMLLAACGQTQKTSVQNNQEKKSLFIYCAAGLKKPMQEIAKKFEEQYGAKIEYTFANSSVLIGQMEITHKGDLCLLASNEDYEIANKKDLILEKKDLVYHVPVIAVPKGNPADIQKIQDLAKPNVKVILGDPKTSPLGKLGSKLFKNANIEEQVNKNIVSTVPTVNELVTFLSMKKADASIIWEDNALNAFKQIDFISIPKEQNLIKVVPIASLKSSKDKELSKKFLDFTTSDQGKSIFVKYNLKPVN